MRNRSMIPAIQLGSTSTRYRAARVVNSRNCLRNSPFNCLLSDASIPDVTVDPIGFIGGKRTHRLARLEAVLFLSRESLNSRKLSEYADLEDGTEARTLVSQLNQLYQDEQSVLRVERVAGGYQLVTHWQFGRWLKRLGAGQSGVRLSAPAMETLAVVAYRQPVLRAEVEAIRGVSCGEMLRQLMDRDLVRIRGRSEELGRPYLYGTTKRFLQEFGLDSIDELLETDMFAALENVVEEELEINEMEAGEEGEELDESWDEDDSDDDEIDDDEDEYGEDDSDDEYLEDEEEEEWEGEDEWEEVEGDDDELDDDSDEIDDDWQDEDDWDSDDESDDDDEDDDEEEDDDEDF